MPNRMRRVRCATATATISGDGMIEKFFEKVQLGQPGHVETELVGEHDLLNRLLVAGRLRLLRGAGQLVRKDRTSRSNSFAHSFARNPSKRRLARRAGALARL